MRILSITMVLMALACFSSMADSGAGSRDKTVAVSAADMSSPALDSEIKRSLLAIKVFTGRLQGELMKAMRAGGPTNAIMVCNSRAKVIAAEISAQQGLNMRT